jgi:hypothetical protein
MNEKPRRWSLEQGVGLARAIQAAVEPLGAHVGLLGSVLTKGSSEKDLDVLIYPANASTPPTRESLHDALKGIGMRLIGDEAWIKKRWAAAGGTDTKSVEFWIFRGGKRVDVFYLS